MLQQKFKFLFLLLLPFILIGCIKEEKTLNILMPNGAPSLAQIFIEDKYETILDYKLNIERVSDTKLIQAGFLSEKYDIIYSPINIGVSNYNTNKAYLPLGSITNGNIYLISNGSLDSFNDLNNKDLYLFGENTINDSVVKYLLDKYNIKANINYESSTQVTSQLYLNSKESDVFLVAEPQLSKILNNNTKILDINLELKKYDINFYQAAVFYKNDINIDLINEYEKLLIESINKVKEDNNSLNQLLNKINIGLKDLSIDTVKRSNINFNKINKKDLESLINLNEKLFKGYPDEAFYL